MALTTNDGYHGLLKRISATYTQGRVQAVQAVNTRITETYWQVGQHIVEFEQAGKDRAVYGEALITNLANDLSLRHGKGFSRSNLIRIRQFYLAYPKGATLSHLLSWSHIVELLKIEDPLERSFHEQQTNRGRWSVRELIRQKESSLFLRLANSQNKAGVLQLAAAGRLLSSRLTYCANPMYLSSSKFRNPIKFRKRSLKLYSAIISNRFFWKWARALPLSGGNIA
jgi:DUF1016 N-terminal domain